MADALDPGGREFAIRAALGAPATRLGRRLGAVAFLHVVPGLLAGLALGALAVRLLSGYLGWPLPAFVPTVAVGVALVVALATGISLVGPLLRAGRVSPRAVLQEG